MSLITEVEITWMDGKTATYPCETAVVNNGVLLLHGTGTYSDRQSSRGFPLANIREWRAEQR
jgi:hypothetical protein